MVRVIDDGTGLAPGDLSRIFEMLTQIDQANTRSRGGLGICLEPPSRDVRGRG